MEGEHIRITNLLCTVIPLDNTKNMVKITKK